MSWYSDGERFNEWDDPYCVWKNKATGGRCGNSKAECDRCMRLHMEDENEKDNDDME